MLRAGRSSSASMSSLVVQTYVETRMFVGLIPRWRMRFASETHPLLRLPRGKVLNHVNMYARCVSYTTSSGSYCSRCGVAFLSDRPLFRPDYLSAATYELKWQTDKASGRDHLRCSVGGPHQWALLFLFRLQCPNS